MVQGAEENIYKSLEWAGLKWDEGPIVGGPYGPYRQSERAEIYSKYANQLIESGNAYRCFCSKDRLDSLRASARKLHPPSMASYDRKCSHLSSEEALDRVQKGQEYTIRFKAPLHYPEFIDLLHGKLNMQTQVNPDDVRYDDPVLVKSDGLPTYHLANVVDDHLMKITHVVRGEEWLASTPKHVAMYKAFGWKPPSFVHIPLLTTTANKKLSKRAGDIGVLSLAEKGILPEAMINYVALYGWSPSSTSPNSDIFTLKELEKAFSLNGLTRGNAKVDEKKLIFLNKHFFQVELNNDPKKFNQFLDTIHSQISEKLADTEQDSLDVSKSLLTDKEYTLRILNLIKTSITSVEDFIERTKPLYYPPTFDLTESSSSASKYLSKLQKDGDVDKILIPVLTETTQVMNKMGGSEYWANFDNAKEFCNHGLLEHFSQFKKPQVFQALRFGLSGNVPGIDIPTIIYILGPEVVSKRFETALKVING